MSSSASNFAPVEKQFHKLSDYYGEENLLPKLLQGYFRQARLQASFRFARTEIEVADSPDLQVQEGAGICAQAQIQDGQFSFTQPLALGGFRALGGFYDFCSVDSDAAGKVRLKSCACSLPKDSDITEPVLKGPLATLFPERRVHALPFSDLLQALAKPPAGAASGEDPLLGALRFVQLKAQIPGDLWVDDSVGTFGGSCHPLSASLEAYLDVPALKDNLASGLWRSFDFAGLERGSKLLWPRFDLSRLPLPEGWEILEGRADLEVRHFPEAGKTEIKILKLKARAKIPALFGDGELVLEGGAQLRLQRGGEIQIDWNELRVEAPTHSLVGGALPNLSAILSGSLHGNWKAGKFELSKLGLRLRDLQIQVPEDQSAPLGKSGLAWRGTLVGQGDLEYEPPARRWRRLDFELSGDLALLNSEGTSLLKAEGLGLDLKGDSERLLLKGDAVALSYGLLALRPEFSFELKPSEDFGEIEAKGDLSLSGLNLPLALVTALEMKAGAEAGEAKLGPINFRYKGRDLTKKGRAELTWSKPGLRGGLSLPDLPGGNALDLQFRRPADSERLSGSFKLRPAKIRLSPGLFADDLRLSGSFSTEAWTELIAKPKLNLKARIAGNLGGSLAGPFGADLQGSLSYSPAQRSIYLWLNPRRDSALHLGPLRFSGDPRRLEADLPLKGTWQAVLLPRGVLIGGRGVGIQGGVVSLGEGPSKTKVVVGLDLVADQLWSVQNGIAYAGGDGIRLEGRVDTGAFLGSEVQGLGERKIFLVADQLPLSPEAYWQLFAKGLKKEEAR